MEFLLLLWLTLVQAQSNTCEPPVDSKTPAIIIIIIASVIAIWMTIDIIIRYFNKDL